MEDYVTFELARKLKEKGYPQRTLGDYDMIGACYFEDGKFYKEGCIALVEDCFTAPTIHQVLKWLMDEKRIFVEVNLLSGGWSYVIKEIAPLMGYDLKTYLKYEDSWEQAHLSGIRYVIDNLI